MSSPILTLPQIPKNIDRELFDYLTNLTKILQMKQSEEFGLDNLLKADIATLKADIATLKSPILCQGTLGGETTTWQPSRSIPLYPSLNVGGFTQNGNVKRVYPPKKGYYLVTVQQMVLLSGGHIYYWIQKNKSGGKAGHTDYTGAVDMVVSMVLHLKTTDYISLYAQVSASFFFWGGTGHSAFSMIYLGE